MWIRVPSLADPRDLESRSEKTHRSGLESGEGGRVSARSCGKMATVREGSGGGGIV